MIQAWFHRRKNFVLYWFCIAPLVAAVGHGLRRLKQDKTFLKNYLPFDDADVKVVTLPERTAVPQKPPPSVPRRLLQPFAAAAPASSFQSEIKTEKLLEACRELKAAMTTLGQDRNAAEIERNLQKIEALHRIAPQGRKEDLRSLLEYEKELGIHGPNAQLKDPSAAMGMLWIRRSLAFQERMYSLILDQKIQSNEAAMQAYHETLEPFHGWALRQVYSIALRSTTPPREKLLQKLRAVPADKFGSAEEMETMQDLRKLCETWKPLLNTMKETFEALGLEDSRKV